MSVQAQPETFAVGDAVKVNPVYAGKADLNKVFRVAKVPTGPNGVNYNITPVGAGVGLRARGAMLLLATDEEVALAEAAAPQGERPVLGSVVKVDLPAMSEEHYVVTSIKRDGCFQLARLGGDGGRYFTSVSPKVITVVDPATVQIG